MAKFRLLLVDAVIVIYLFEISLWDAVVSQCDVHVSEEILREAHFYEDDAGEQHPTHIERYRSRLIVHDVPASQLNSLLSGLGGSLLERMDPGEAELLCVLHNALEAYSICSADAVVFRYLGATNRSMQGVSLEELLTGIGRTRQVPHQYTKAFREQYTRRGFEEGITGQAFRPSTNG